MGNHVTVRFHIEGPKVSLDSFAWSDLKAFMEVLIPAIAAMDGGPTRNEVLPVKVEPGSVQPALRIPRHTLPGVYALRDGNHETWTPTQRAKAGRLWDHIERQGWRSVTCGIKRQKLVRVPKERPDWRLRERTSLLGRVTRAGGKDGGVGLDVAGFGHLHCRAGRETTKALAKRLYETVRVDGLALRDVRTSQLIGFEISSFRPVERTGAVSALLELHEALGDSMVAADPGAFLDEIG